MVYRDGPAECILSVDSQPTFVAVGVVLEGQAKGAVGVVTGDGDINVASTIERNAVKRHAQREVDGVGPKPLPGCVVFNGCGAGPEAPGDVCIAIAVHG